MKASRTITAALAGAALLLSAAATTAKAAPLEVFACVPEWASLVKAIGGDRLANVTLATSALDNPESMKPTPGLIASLSKADLIVCTGAGLEDTWLPAMLERAGNAKVVKGKPGYFMASEYVKLIEDEEDEHDHGHGGEKKAAGGHQHEGGNPHIQGDPNNVRLVAGQLAKRLIQLDPEGKDGYTERTKAFIGELTALTKELQGQGGAAEGRQRRRAARQRDLPAQLARRAHRRHRGARAGRGAGPGASGRDHRAGAEAEGPLHHLFRL